MRRRTRRQRGVAVVEFALVAPFLLLMGAGMAEMGHAWVGGSRLESSVSTAARVGSTSGAVADADRLLLLSLQASLPDELLGNVQRVVVFRSDSNGTIHPQCRTASPPGGVSGQCNVYSGAQLQTVTLTSTLGSASWNPTTRNDRLSDPPDYLGVLVVTTQPSLTGTFWGARTIERTSIYRLAPDVDG